MLVNQQKLRTFQIKKTMAQQAVQGTKEWRQPSRFVISVIPGLRNQLAYKPKLSEPLSQLRKASVAQHGFKKRSPGTATHPGNLIFRLNFT